MDYVIAVAVVLYLVFHAFHSRRKWNQNDHLPRHRRIWISLPGPFGTRISKGF